MNSASGGGGFRDGHIGLVGLGRMGTALGHRLLDNGARLVVWNRTPGPASPLVDRGAVAASRPADVAAKCAIVLVVVRDGAALRDVYGGAEGLVAGPLAGVTVVEMTTAALSDIQDAARMVEQAGGRFIDAPVSGTVEPARTGNLVVLAGGAAPDLERIAPLLGMLARKVVHVGPTGSGIVMKLVVNLPLATYWQTLGEALGLGQRHGLALDAMLSVISDSKAAIGALPNKLLQICDVGATVQFNLAGLHKDLMAMCRTAKDLELEMPAATVAAHSAGEAVAAGWGSRDLAQLVRFVADAPASPTRHPGLQPIHGAAP